MTSTDPPEANTYDQARSELREGIESSREILRQSRVLIELAACDALPANDNEDFGAAK